MHRSIRCAASNFLSLLDSRGPFEFESQNEKEEKTWLSEGNQKNKREKEESGGGGGQGKEERGRRGERDEEQRARGETPNHTQHPSSELTQKNFPLSFVPFNYFFLKPRRKTSLLSDRVAFGLCQATFSK